MQSCIPFSSYMEEALYGRSGYYVTDRQRFGASGDFYTNAQVSRSFGVLWADFFSRHAREDRLSIVELGCGDGDFMRAHLPALAHIWDKPIFYAGVDVSAVARERAEAQWRTVCLEHPGVCDRVQASFFEDVEALCISHGERFTDSFLFANEVLDALPCDILQVSRTGRVERLCVEELPPDSGTRVTTKFVRTSDGDLLRYAERYLLKSARSSDQGGVVAEEQSRMQAFVRKVLALLQPQLAVFLDYGGRTTDIVGDDRPNGSLRGYRGHRLVEEWIDFPGECDLTYDVDFDALEDALRDAGYVPEPPARQGAFFTRPEFESVLRVLAKDGRDRAGLKHLILPGGMGDRFFVILARRETSRG